MKTFFSFILITTFLITPLMCRADSSNMHNKQNTIFGKVEDLNPRGLQNKQTPPGLYKQNKTPYGWSQGQKKGWNAETHRNKKHMHKSIRPNLESHLHRYYPAD